jgi:DNA-directed RNA polymerase specialized sigma24 family protein
MHLADKDLISLVGQGDPESFVTLYDRHGRAAYSLAYRMMGEKQAAEDLAQDAFLKLWRSATSYRADLSPRRSCSKRRFVSARGSPGARRPSRWTYARKRSR